MIVFKDFERRIKVFRGYDYDVLSFIKTYSVLFLFGHLSYRATLRDDYFLGPGEVKDWPNFTELVSGKAII